MAQSDYIRQVLDAAEGQEYSTQWYRDKIKEFGTPRRLDLLRDGRRNKSPSFGKLNMFVYGPKNRLTLPYYDTFPLVMPIGGISGGFLGINFHYLPIPLRMRLLDKVVNFPNDVNYQGLKRISLLKPTIKKYLNGFVKSEFRIIQSDEFVVAALLPVHNFKNAKKSVSASEVWADSRSMV
jgi:hypothetical protein